MMAKLSMKYLVKMRKIFNEKGEVKAIDPLTNSTKSCWFIFKIVNVTEVQLKVNLVRVK